MGPWWRREVMFWRVLVRTDPLRTFALLLITAGIALGMGASIYATGRLVQAVTERSEDAWTWLWIAIAGFMLQPVCEYLGRALSSAQQAAITTSRHSRLAHAALAHHGIEHLEDPDRNARLGSLVEHLRSANGLRDIEMAWQAVFTRVSGIAALVIVAAWQWWAALLLLVAQLLLGRAFGAYLSQATSQFYDDEGQEPRRRSRYLMRSLLQRDAAQEVRLFRLTDWIIDAYRREFEPTLHEAAAVRRRALRPGLWSALLVALVTGLALAVLARQAWTGAIEVGSVVTVAMGIQGLVAFGPLGDTSVWSARARDTEQQFTDLGRQVADEVDAEQIDAVRIDAMRIDAGAGRGPSRAVPSGAARVQLNDVGFTYPSRATPTLSGIAVDIPAGQSVAVVGVNGVGKSTLIKLISGLYRPQTGTVHIDGADPAHDEAARRRVSVIFQDFVRYQLSLRENIAMSAESDPRSQPGLQAALEAAAGADVLERLAGDWDTVLHPGYNGGTDLSGGQWQRVALARALNAVRHGAGVLILDEPTAALDVRAEAQIFERFLQVTQGVTTILVSHRLSSVRHAARIVVLSDRGVVEDGSHEELLAADGEYARMFRLQASRFAAAGAES
ncbi:ATP-binding cassette domain-containing protein [Dermacoccaceae bacterium W4C1]